MIANQIQAKRGSMSSNPHYHSYMLRLWRDNANHPWRALLQCTATGEKLAFADILTLFAFLTEQLARGEEQGELARLATWLQTQIADGSNR
jgi:hypothetical protein